MTTPTTTPSLPAAEQVRRAVGDRQRADYQFGFWSAFGWTLLTFGIYSFYVFYQLVRRSRDHNRRRLALLAAATELAWDQAIREGKAEELRSSFDQVGVDIERLRSMDREFRDPAVWTLLAVIGSGVAWAFGAILLDHDLVRHERHERAAEAGLTAVFGALGVSLPAPVQASKQPHNYVGRIIAAIVTFGLYSLWWVANLMREGNANYVADYAWEDALLGSLSDEQVATT